MYLHYATVDHGVGALEGVATQSGYGRTVEFIVAIAYIVSSNGSYIHGSYRERVVLKIQETAFTLNSVCIVAVFQ